MADQDARIAALEARLARLEALLAGSVRAATTEVPAAAMPGPGPAIPSSQAASPAAAAPIPKIAAKPGPSAGSDASLVGNVLGWGGALALVLAASYLIRLAIDSGWLTPIRQVCFAAIFGLLLVAAGFVLRRRYRDYAGLLPAAGIAVLFLAVYGGHLYHHVIALKEAGVAVMLVCAVSLWLCRAFESDLYALFAVVGSYSAPFLLMAGSGTSLTDLAVYFSAWGVVFSVFAIWHRRRLVYLLALYLALIGFDFAARGRATEAWTMVMAFQGAQFVIFGIATAWFTVRNDAPLGKHEAMAHLPPLVLFYFLQYSLLDRHLPVWAPWIATASLAAMAALYGGARALLQRPLPGGELLLWSYAALVLFHAGYIESVPREWAPWFALALVPAMALAATRIVSDDDEPGMGALWPMWLAVGIIFAVNYLRIIFDAELGGVPGRPLLAVAYALLLYAGYWFFCRRDEEGGNRSDTVRVLLLYTGHLSAMAAALRLLNDPIVESAAWGLLAIACLVLSLQSRDKLLGQSSLALFAATAGKVLLYDLAGASPVARIIGLVVLGVTFYAGGLLYQRLLKNASTD